MPSGVRSPFPEKGIESAVGVPIYGCQRTNHRPYPGEGYPGGNGKTRRAILKIFAARAGAEIERYEGGKELEKA